MVIGGGEDKIYNSAMITQTARAYDVEPVILPGACHMIMSDPQWREAADRILEWLGGK